MRGITTHATVMGMDRPLRTGYEDGVKLIKVAGFEGDTFVRVTVRALRMISKAPLMTKETR